MPETKMTARDVKVFYGEKQAIKGVSIDVDMDNVTAFIGPSGCGKSTFLRTLNRMNDTVASARVEGTITLDGEDIYAPSMDVVQLRARVGMVFQKPNPFPKSIYENIAYGPRIHGLAHAKADLDVIVEKSLRRAGLWDEVKDRLHDSGTALSGGQQQRLCIGRAIAVEPASAERAPKMTARDVRVFYGEKEALKGVDIDIFEDRVTAFIGPSGCGKSTFLRCLNRMNDTIPSARVTGRIELDGEDINSAAMDVVQLRARVGMVFQKPNPFPKSIYENVAYGPRIHGLAAGKTEMDAIVEKSLRRAGLWDEVKDRLQESGTALSGGQQQRLCIARAIAVDPEVILMDEPCSALDPIATARIEELIHDLRGRYAIAIVTHNMQQAARVSQRTAFFHLGEMVEYGKTSEIFTNPRQQRTQDYITGRYG